MNHFYLQTAFCGLRICYDRQALLGIDFVSTSARARPLADELAQRIRYQISAYCRSADSPFDVPLQPRGTEFQRRVWQALLDIPVGQVRSYGDIADQLGSSPRAVGNACRANPIPLIIPCHRVVAANGIGGFAGQTRGSRLAIKRRLLAHEGVEI